MAVENEKGWCKEGWFEMSNLIRAIAARLPQYAIPSDFVDERSVADVVQDQYGDPEQPTAMKQIADSAAGKSPTTFVNKIQVDR